VGDAIVFKKLVMPSMDDFNVLQKETEKYVVERKVRPKDVKEAIKRARK
jgi:hypothetical protein